MNPQLRDAYETEVRALRERGEAMLVAGQTLEQVARTLYVERRALGVRYKELTPPDLLERITQRNLRVYGDPLGPTIEFLREKGKTWEQIIESASTPGGRDLGF